MSTYFAILTDIGEAKQANAIALGVSWDLTQMAIGDANGAAPVPNRLQRSLIHEVRRGALNQLSVDPVNQSQVIAEQVIPAEEGGWWIRELGLYDSAGDLCAVANCAPSYKPLLAEGSGRTQLIRIVLIVASTTAITLKIDPSVVLATRSYADNAIVAYASPLGHTHAVSEILPGGAVKQILRKKTAVSGDVEWADLPTAGDLLPGGLIKQVLRKRTATAGDVEWVDLPALDPAQNLNDVADKTASRKNIGAMIQMTGVPLMWPTLDCPSWSVVRDGSALTRTAYADLFPILCPLRTGVIALNAGGAVITGLSRTSDLWAGMPVEHANLPAGTSVKSIDSASQVTLSVNATAAAASAPLRFFLFGYGNGGSATTFGVPDDRGLFQRALDSGARGYEKTVLSGTTTLGSNVITGVASTRGLFIGQAISAPAAISAGAVISGLTASTITMSLNSPQAGTATITVVGGQVGNERTDDIKSHTHGLNIVGVSNYAGNGDAASRGSIVNPGGPANDLTWPTGGAETRPRFRSYLPIIVI